MKKLLITGAAGFIGGAATTRFQNDWHVIGIDNMLRGGSTFIPDDFYVADILDIDDLPLLNVDAVLHLAAQTSVTRSLTSPEHDFRTNAYGTFKVVQWALRHGVGCFIYASTNKVFGEGDPKRTVPFEDSTVLRPDTPYAISKATGHWYVQEARYDISRYTFHQSCVYGPTQTGSEDQGWACYLKRRLVANKPVTIFGDGEQVRDLLHIDDLLDAYEMALEGNLDAESYVIGGGVGSTTSVRNFVEFHGGRYEITYEPTRPHDQRYFVSANSGLEAQGWKPKRNWGTYIPGMWND